jgi:hypothetical protein
VPAGSTYLGQPIDFDIPFDQCRVCAHMYRLRASAVLAALICMLGVGRLPNVVFAYAVA